MAFGPAKSDVGFFGGLGLMGRAFLLALLSRLNRRAMVCGLHPFAICMVVSRRASCIPSQNEPHTIQGWSLSSITKLGSIAFQLSRFSRDVTILPSSSQMPEANLRVDNNPIVDPFLPKVEQLYAIHQRLCHLIMSGAYRRRVLAEGRAAVSQPPATMPLDDIWSPYMVGKTRNGIVGPLRNYRHHRLCMNCPVLAVDGCHMLYAHACGEDMISTILIGHNRVVDHRRICNEGQTPPLMLLCLRWNCGA